MKLYSTLFIKILRTLCSNTSTTLQTGDDDFQPNAEETRSSLLRQDEGQNEMMLSVCRNAGQGQSRVGKRKISWQDPVALRV